MFLCRLSVTGRPILAASLLLFATSIAVRAQGLGTIVGTVTDPSGAVVPNAQVKLVEEGTSATREATSDSQGYYVFPSLRPSTYSLTVEVSGFATFSRKAIILQADQSATVNVALSVAVGGQTVTVSGEVPLVTTATSTLSEVVDGRRIVDLPLDGRNAASLALVTAGTLLAPNADGADQGNTKTFPSAVLVNSNGARQNQTSYRLDGANNTDIYTNVNQPFPNPDAIQEFSVQTSNYSAKYGGNAGGVVNIVTRSGTNDLHGTAYEFVRNADFNARNFFAAKRDPLKRNQFGGVFGGPVDIPRVYNGKNKTFFFLSYQGTRIHTIGSTSSEYVPTTANLDGDFSAYLSASNPANALGKATTIIDPLSGSAFPGNLIPTSRFDPAALAFTKYLPISSGSGLTYYTLPTIQDFDEATVRMDHSIGTKDHLSGRYFYDRFLNVGFLDLTNYPAQSSNAIIDSNNFMLNETHVFTPSLLSDFRASFIREVSSRGPASGSIDATQLGVKMYEPPGDHILESLSVSSFFSVGQSDPATFTRDQYSLNEDLSWVKGNHNMTFGVNAIRAWVLIRNQFHQPGNFGFTADVTNLALASYFLGYLRTFLQGNGEFKDNRVNSFGLYYQDDWHISRRLTLNLGLRYDPFFPWKETKGRIEIFSPSAYAAGVTSSVYTNAPPGLLFPGDPGVPQYGNKSNYKNFEPRIGFAWDVQGNGKTSIRGGFGMFYDSMQNGIYNNRFVDTSPFSVQINLNPVNPNPPIASFIPFSNPYLGMTNPFPAPYPPPKNIAFPLPDLAASYDIGHGGTYQTPVTYEWNLTAERQLRGDWMIRAAYVGSHESHGMENVELSPNVYPTGKHLFPQYSDIAMAMNDINASYNSLQLTAQKRFSKGFTILANYTFAKSIDDWPYGQDITTVVAGGNSPIPWNFPGRHQFDRGPSDFDRTHRFVASFVYYLPSLSHAPAALRYIAGGWGLTGIITAQTGYPFTVTYGKDVSGTALSTDRPVLLASTTIGPGACGTAAPCVDYLVPTAFGTPAAGTFGNLGKGSLRGPNSITYNGGLSKEFPLYKERVRLQFRAEYFNLFNRVNFNNPATSVTGAGFGRITGAGDPRIGQLALKLIF
ncbi:MAG TPA: carboxypeptidase regulatory-like domain-containing protein [Bryobacteraceae bacterium]|nr:carboxypeptidase regulatory-like domain-containing protein [Bryobacteraceae bacterium]